MIEQLINIDRMENVIALFGSFDENIKLIENEFSVKILNRDAQIKVSGEDVIDVSKAIRAIDGLLLLLNKGDTINEQNVRYIISMINDDNDDQISQLADDSICINSRGKPIRPKTLGQKKYLDAISKNTIVIGIGPAGTGKTYLAVAMAVKAFRSHEVNKIF